MRTMPSYYYTYNTVICEPTTMRIIPSYYYTGRQYTANKNFAILRKFQHPLQLPGPIHDRLDRLVVHQASQPAVARVNHLHCKKALRVPSALQLD